MRMNALCEYILQADLLCNYGIDMSDERSRETKRHFSREIRKENLIVQIVYHYYFRRMHSSCILFFSLSSHLKNLDVYSTDMIISSAINWTESSTFVDTEQTRSVKFVLLVALESPVLIFNLILLYYLLVDRTLRHKIHYHAFVPLLLVTLLSNVVELPRIIHDLHIGMVVPQIDINCLFWQWCNYFLFGSVNISMFWISFERYFLIFDESLYTTSKRRFLFHYLLMIGILVLHIFAVFIYRCERKFDFSEPLCMIWWLTLEFQSDWLYYSSTLSKTSVFAAAASSRCTTE